MRSVVLVCLFVFGVALRMASADPHTTTAVVVRKAPKPKARAVGKLPANTPVTIDREEGDWIRIRARVGRKRIVGYVARGALATDAPPPPATAAAEDDSEEGFTAPEAREPRKALEVVVVRKKPGEKQAAAGTLAVGTVVEVEGEKGRWLRIRAGSLRGYVPRTTISGPEVATDTTAFTPAPSTTPAPPPTDEPTRRWRTPDRSPALSVEVTTAATLRAEPRPDAAAVAEVARGARLVVVDATSTPGFVQVRDDQGRAGWIARADVGNGSAAAAVAPIRAGEEAPRVAVRTETPRADTPALVRGAPPRRFAIRVDAGIGYRILGMDFTSNGAAGLANYVGTSGASAIDLDVDAAMQRGRMVIGLDAKLGASRSSPGLDYPGPSGPPGEIPFSTVAVDAGVRVGMRARRLFVIAARAGAHYDAFVTRDVENAGMLPRERLLGTTLGARVDVVPPASRVTATLHADALVFGNRRQTPGLEDGASSTARAVWAGVIARFAVARRIAVHAAYDFGRATTEWSGMSVRDPGVTSARRVDSTQLFQVGLSLEL